MNAVSAGQELYGIARRMKRLKTDCTIDAGCVGQTAVRVKGGCFHTNAAFVAVGVFYGTAHATDSTVGTMILALVFVV